MSKTSKFNNITEQNPSSYPNWLSSIVYVNWAIPALVMVVMALWVVGFRVHSIYDFTLDDSFITYRYAKHLAQGYGLIWNIGESPPVEGYTTFLWVIINAVFEVLRLDPEQFSKYLSILSMVIILPLLSLTPFSISNKLAQTQADAKIKNLSKLKIICAGIFLSSYFLISPYLPAHAVSGMETMFSALLLLMLAINFAYFDLVTARLRIILPSALALACGLIRPEFNAGVFLAFIVLWAIWFFWIKDKKIARQILISFAVYIVLGLMFFVWRYYYYGLMFPLPFYIKQLEPSSEIFKGLKNMNRFYGEYWAFILIGVVGVISNPKRLLAPFVLALAVFIYFYFPAHIMGIYFRFIFPLLPIMLWLSASAIHKAISVSFVPSPIWSLGMMLLCLTFVFGADSKKTSRPDEIRYLQFYDARWRNNFAWLNDYNKAEHRSLIPLGKAINKDLQNNSEKLKIAMVDLGAVAYFGNWHMIDLFGLTHPKLALARAKGKYNANMLLEEEPDIVLLGEFFREKKYRGQFPFELDLYNRMKNYNYRPIARFQWNRVFGFLAFSNSDIAAERFIKVLKSSNEIAPSTQDLR